MPNPHAKRPEIVERLFVTTLALQAAASDEDWPQYEALMVERERLLDHAVLARIDPQTLSQVREAETRLMQILQSKREHLLSDLDQSLRGRQFQAAVTIRTPMSSFDNVG